MFIIREKITTKLPMDRQDFTASSRACFKAVPKLISRATGIFFLWLFLYSEDCPMDRTRPITIHERILARINRYPELAAPSIDVPTVPIMNSGLPLEAILKSLSKVLWSILFIL